MRKIRNWVIGGIQNKVLSLVLITILLLVGVYTSVILWQTRGLQTLVSKTTAQQEEHISTTMKQALGDQLAESMIEAAELEAYIADGVFGNLASVVTVLADYATRLYASPEGYPVGEVQPPDASKDGQTSVQLLTAAGVDLADPSIAQQLSLVSSIGNLLVSLFDNTQIDSCYIALPSGVMLLADDHPSSKFDANGTVEPIDMVNRPWYTGAVAKGGIYFSDVTADVFSGKMAIMCAMPIYRGDELVAVVGADLMLDDLETIVESSAEGGMFACVVNDHGHVIFSPMKEGSFKVVEESSNAADLREGDSALAGFISKAFNGFVEPTVVEVDGKNYYLCAAPIQSVGWVVMDVATQEVADAVTEQVIEDFSSVVDAAQEQYSHGLSNSVKTMAALVIVVMVVALTAAMVVSRRIVGPLGRITERVGALGGDDLHFNMEDAYRTGDEVEVLAESFANLSAKTLKYVDEVTRVTAEKERIGAELDMATDIQASQLPRLFPAFPHRSEFDVYAVMDPAKEVGGDFYDFFLVDDNHIGLVMADVSGKGVPAALFMMVARVLIKSHLQSGESPAETLEHVNDQLCQGNDVNYFVTVWISVVEIATGKGVAANAGHEHPALRRAGGRYELVVYRHGPGLGLMEGIPFREHDFKLEPGDSLFVYTDGVAEATNANNELFGTDRMLEALNEDPDASPREVLANVRAGVDAFVGEAEQFDDLTMLCFRYDGGR